MLKNESEVTVVKKANSPFLVPHIVITVAHKMIVNGDRIKQRFNTVDNEIIISPKKIQLVMTEK